MRVITLASRKGGAGKTTLAGHIAVEAERSGAGPVAVVDCDPQGSLSSWWNDRLDSSPRYAMLQLSELEEGLADLKNMGMELVIIDTPPTLSSVVARAIACADLVVIPLRPSPHDLRSVGATLDLAETFDKRFLFVLNAAGRRSPLAKESRDLLAELGPVAETVVHFRVDYAASMSDGRVAGEVARADAAAREIEGLWCEIDKLLTDESLKTVTSILCNGDYGRTLKKTTVP